MALALFASSKKKADPPVMEATPFFTEISLLEGARYAERLMDVKHEGEYPFEAEARRAYAYTLCFAPGKTTTVVDITTVLDIGLRRFSITLEDALKLGRLRKLEEVLTDYEVVKLMEEPLKNAAYEELVEIYEAAPTARGGETIFCVLMSRIGGNYHNSEWSAVKPVVKILADAIKFEDNAEMLLRKTGLNKDILERLGLLADEGIKIPDMVREASILQCLHHPELLGDGKLYYAEKLAKQRPLPGLTSDEERIGLIALVSTVANVSTEFYIQHVRQMRERQTLEAANNTTKLE